MISLEKENFLRILVVGETGQGKSTFIKKLLGKDVAKEGDSRYASGVTKDLNEYYGKIDGFDRKIIFYDTPGFNDSDVDPFDYINLYEEKCKDLKFDCIIYVLKRTDYRFDRYAKLFLQIVSIFFQNTDISLSVIVTITHCDLIKCSRSEDEFAHDILTEMNKQLNWSISRYLLFNKFTPENTTVKLLDYLNHLENKLIIKKSIPLQEMSQLFSDSFKGEDHFWGINSSLFNEINEKNHSPQNLEAEKKIFEIVLIGDPNVGKSSFVQKLSNPRANIDIAIPTMGNFFIIQILGCDFIFKKTSLIYEKNEEFINFQIWDTAGQERFNSIQKTYIKRADSIFLMFSLNDPISFNNLDSWIKIVDEYGELNQLIYLVGTKSDELEKRKISKEMAEIYARKKCLSYFEISAKNYIGLDELLEKLALELIKSKKRSKEVNKIFKIKNDAQIQMISVWRRISNCCKR
jgi:small GTP-binding protein